LIEGFLRKRYGKTAYTRKGLGFLFFAAFKQLFLFPFWLQYSGTLEKLKN